LTNLIASPIYQSIFQLFIMLYLLGYTPAGLRYPGLPDAEMQTDFLKARAMIDPEQKH
jgi:hypothetical protein